MKKIISVLLIISVISVSANVFAFSDVPDGHWADEYISRLSELSVINGYEDGTFVPEGSVTRAEFAKMLSLAFDASGSKNEYADTENHWAKEYIEKTAEFVYTASEDYFPDKNASRAEIAYALAGVLNLEKADGEALEFSDWDTVIDAMAEKVELAVANGIVEGYEDGTIRGNGEVTRAEACALIVRAIDFESENTEVPPEVEVLPPETEIPSAPEPENPVEDTLEDPLYTGDPLKDLMLVVSLTTVMGEGGADVDYKLTYRIAGSETEYTSVLKGDSNTVVAGTKSSLKALAEGDVFVFDTAFHGYIDTIYVVASFGSGEVSIPKGFEKGSGEEYEFVAGKVVSRTVKSKSVVIGVEGKESTMSVTVPHSAAVTAYNHGKGNPWLEDSVKGIEEEMFVLVRYTDSKVTEVVAAKI